MKFRKYIASSAPEAIQRIRTDLGPDAVVIHVRQLSGGGLSRLWRRPRVEVLASVPNPPATVAAATDRSRKKTAVQTPSRPAATMPRGNAESLAALRASLSSLRTDPRRIPNAAESRSRGGYPTGNEADLIEFGSDGAGRRGSTPREPGVRVYGSARFDSVDAPHRSPDRGSSPLPASTALPRPFAMPIDEIESRRTDRHPDPGPKSATETVTGGQSWRSRKILSAAGFDDLPIQAILERVQQVHGARPPRDLTGEIDLIRGTLRDLWPDAPESDPGGVHILVGPSGVGKTTALCKWMTRSVLEEGRTAQVCRVDSDLPNLAETVSIHAEILGVPVTRTWCEGAEGHCDTTFIDLPGVDWRDGDAMDRLGGTLRRWPGAQVHLVLNAAYDTGVLLDQARGFESIPSVDLILTHTDEIRLWGRLWNLVLGTNFCVRFLGGGQNIPGRFQPACVDVFLNRLFPAKQGANDESQGSVGLWQRSCLSGGEL